MRENIAIAGTRIFFFDKMAIKIKRPILKSPTMAQNVHNICKLKVKLHRDFGIIRLEGMIKKPEGGVDSAPPHED